MQLINYIIYGMLCLNIKLKICICSDVCDAQLVYSVVFSTFRIHHVSLLLFYFTFLHFFSCFSPIRLAVFISLLSGLVFFTYTGNINIIKLLINWIYGVIISASFFVPPFILFCTVPLNYSPFLLTIMFFISFSAPDFNNSVTLCLTPPPSHLTPQQGEGPSSDRLRAGPGPQRQAGPGQQ